MSKWTINKIGLINFWYYDEEEFEFSDGRLLLRGSNGSGKSVTMQSFIPLLLDGNRSARRLDPFGTNSRKIENYLLTDNDSRDENTGYLYMEFVKPETGNFITVGIGLKAKKNKQTEFWGFSITDGKRIGKDFKLYKEVGDKILLTKRELKNRIVDNGMGEFFERADDYKAMVNKYIFGFEDIAEYDQLIDLLVQLRSPKLSKDYKPTVLYEIMEESLKPLSDDDLRPMSEAIENMDMIEASILGLKSALESANRLKVIYDRYNMGVLYYKAKNYINALNLLNETEERINSLTAEINEGEAEILKETENISQLNQNREILKDKIQRYKNTDIYELNQRIIELDNEIDGLNKKLNDKESLKSSEEDSLRKADIKLKEYKDDYELKKYQFGNILNDMKEYSDAGLFTEHKYFYEELIQSDDYEFSVIKASVKKYSKDLKKAIDCFRDVLNAEREYDRCDEAYSNEKVKLDEIFSELKRAEMLFNDVKSSFLEKLYEWNKNNKQLILSEETLQRISQVVYEFDELNDSLVIGKEVSDEYVRLQAELKGSISVLTENLNKTENDINELKLKIRDVESQPEIMPDVTEEQAELRKMLDNLNIPYIPFYRAFDFKEGLSDDEKGRIEEALEEMGLLNALIIPKQYRNKISVSLGMADKFIIPMNENNKEITVPLKSEKGMDISEDELDEILAQINNKNGDIYINNNETYSISIIKGFVGGKRESRYIGAESRRKHKEEIIARLNRELCDKKDEYELLNDKKERLIDLNDLLDKEYSSFPTDNDLTTALSILKDRSAEKDHHLKIRDELAADVKCAAENLNEYRGILNKVCEPYGLIKTYDAYNEALLNMEEYDNCLTNLIVVYKDMCSSRGYMENISESIEKLSMRIDELFADIRDIKNNINKLTDRKKNYEDLKKQSGYEAIEAELEVMQREIEETIPRSINKSNLNIGIRRSDVSHKSEILEKIKNDFMNIKNEYEYLKSLFIEEYELGYNDIDEPDTKKAAEIVLKNKMDKSAENLKDELVKKYYGERQQLADYSVTEDEIFTDDGGESAGRVRLVLMARVRGVRTDFYKFIEYLENEINENEALLTQKDKELFENLLIDTVGRKMRAKISNSERWVNEMNHKMMNMDTSSGLSFSLEWKSKPADSDEQLSTSELVKLLKTDIKLLSDENIEKISKHYRSKLKMARLRRNEGGGAESMHAILKDILDYRKWFEFKLFYTMTGEKKKELTNNAFFRFSGGEKAMAMYVPLFASVYARYEKASSDAPKLISLDEAFAGIDDKNIADMFRIMEELNLSYIINSQVLWGTYSTVPSISICELNRPNNSDTVSVIRYKWNGKSKELIV